MGLTLIEADVFRSMRDSVGTDAHGHPNWFATTRDAALLTASGVPAILNQTEDMAFLSRAAQAGYQPAVDTSAEAFGWHLDAKSLTAYPSAQWKEFITRGTVTWPTAAGPVVWGNAA